MIKRFPVQKTCCGSSAWVLQTEKPIQKQHVEKFREKGYIISPAFEKSGIFYCQVNFLTISGSFGATMLQIRCSKDCDQSIQQFEVDFETIVA